MLSIINLRKGLIIRRTKFRAISTISSAIKNKIVKRNVHFSDMPMELLINKNVLTPEYGFLTSIDKKPKEEKETLILSYLIGIVDDKSDSGVEQKSIDQFNSLIYKIVEFNQVDICPIIEKFSDNIDQTKFLQFIEGYLTHVESIEDCDLTFTKSEEHTGSIDYNNENYNKIKRIQNIMVTGYLVNKYKLKAFKANLSTLHAKINRQTLYLLLNTVRLDPLKSEISDCMDRIMNTLISRDLVGLSFILLQKYLTVESQEIQPSFINNYIKELLQKHLLVLKNYGLVNTGSNSEDSITPLSLASSILDDLTKLGHMFEDEVLKLFVETYSAHSQHIGNVYRYSLCLSQENRPLGLSRTLLEEELSLFKIHVYQVINNIQQSSPTFNNQLIPLYSVLVDIMELFFMKYMNIDLWSKLPFSMQYSYIQKAFYTKKVHEQELKNKDKAYAFELIRSHYKALIKFISGYDLADNDRVKRIYFRSRALVSVFSTITNEKSIDPIFIRIESDINRLFYKDQELIKMLDFDLSLVNGNEKSNIFDSSPFSLFCVDKGCTDINYNETANFIFNLLVTMNSHSLLVPNLMDFLDQNEGMKLDPLIQSSILGWFVNTMKHSEGDVINKELITKLLDTDFFTLIWDKLFKSVECFNSLSSCINIISALRETGYSIDHGEYMKLIRAYIQHASRIIKNRKFNVSPDEFMNLICGFNVVSKNLLFYIRHLSKVGHVEIDFTDLTSLNLLWSNIIDCFEKIVMKDRMMHKNSSSDTKFNKESMVLSTKESFQLFMWVQDIFNNVLMLDMSLLKAKPLNPKEFLNSWVEALKNVNYNITLIKRIRNNCGLNVTLDPISIIHLMNLCGDVLHDHYWENIKCTTKINPTHDFLNEIDLIRQHYFDSQSARMIYRNELSMQTFRIEPIDQHWGKVIIRLYGSMGQIELALKVYKEYHQKFQPNLNPNVLNMLLKYYSYLKPQEMYHILKQFSPKETGLVSTDNSPNHSILTYKSLFYSFGTSKEDVLSEVIWENLDKLMKYKKVIESPLIHSIIHCFIKVKSTANMNSAFQKMIEHNLNVKFKFTKPNTQLIDLDGLSFDWNNRDIEEEYKSVWEIKNINESNRNSIRQWIAYKTLHLMIVENIYHCFFQNAFYLLQFAIKNFDKNLVFHDLLLSSIKKWLLRVHQSNDPKKMTDIKVPDQIKFQILNYLDQLKP